MIDWNSERDLNKARLRFQRQQLPQGQEQQRSCVLSKAFTYSLCIVIVMIVVSVSAKDMKQSID